ncbi:protein mono-ADP-ribosyltransferase PARP14-like [Haliotis rubra]|uniref:protein mono-ADP-ribosyltransferase PARP14-like n=1 Tax=Haliotis rubra TaxID=36100 RepID=UPI001EE62006|nr:protein mono-ADP-ribosyltransferase PARP14-like [Haliotis rubra]
MAGMFRWRSLGPRSMMVLESGERRTLQGQEGCTIEVKEYQPDTHLNLSFLKQQITEVADDVIVSSVGQNQNMLTGQLSRCILRAAGEEIGEEIRTQRPAGLRVAEIVETSGGRLKCKAIYHCRLPHWTNKLSKPDVVLRQVVSDCIINASTQGYKSIAFPALGTGNLGYPKYVTAAAIIDTVREFDNVPLFLADVHVVGCPNDVNFEGFCKRHLQKVTVPEDKYSSIRYLSSGRTLPTWTSSKTESPTEVGVLDFQTLIPKPQMPVVERQGRHRFRVPFSLGDAFVRTLPDRCEEDCTRNVLDKRIQKLKFSQIEDLEAFAEKESIDINTLKSSGQVRLKGTTPRPHQSVSLFGSDSTNSS